MKASKIGTALAGALLIVTSGLATSAEDLGKREYDNNCATCHGSSGKGDGPYAGIINTPIPDLTILQEAGDGVFPFNRVYETVDGRADIKAHGGREMPIWGNEYDEKAVSFYSDYFREYNAEGFVRGRILALVSYIYVLQEK